MSPAPSHEKDPRPTLIFLALRSPIENRRGEAVFVRAHARAAVELGMRPLVLFPRTQATRIETEIGTFEGVPSVALRLLRHLRPAATILGSLATQPLARRAAQRAGSTSQVIFHGFGVLGAAATLARDRPHAKGTSRGARAVTSAYTSLEHEFDAKLRAVEAFHHRGQAMRGRVEASFARRRLTRHEILAYRHADLVLLHYATLERELVARFGPLPTRITPYASERAFLGDAPRPARRVAPPLIAAVAWHDPRKGWPVLLRALALLRDRGVPFSTLLVGGGPLFEVHRQLAHSLGLEGVVQFENDVADSYPALLAAEIFVLPSTQEGSGSVALLEAFQAGCACVVSAVDGLVEDVEEGVNGFTFTPGEPADLARHLERLLRDQALRERMGVGARRTYEARFTAHRMRAALGAVYSDVLAMPPRLPLQR